MPDLAPGRALTFLFVAATLVACGGGGGDSSPDHPPPAPASFTVGGAAIGNFSGSVQVSNRGQQLFADSRFSVFRFDPQPDGSAYDVKLEATPAGWRCNVENGSGIVRGAPVTDVRVVCAPLPFVALSGSVAGLPAGASLMLSVGGKTTRLAAGTTRFDMPAAIWPGIGYSVQAEPDDPWTTCAVQPASGVTHSDLTVEVRCRPADKVFVSLNVSGLGGATGLVLRANGTTDFAVPPQDAVVAFEVPAPADRRVTLQVVAQPAGRTCSMNGGMTWQLAEPVVDADVTCSDRAFAVGGVVSGLRGTGLRLQTSGQDQSVPPGAGSFNFARVAANTSHLVGVASQPAGQQCAVFRGSGIDLVADVTQVQVICSDGRSFSEVPGFPAVPIGGAVTAPDGTLYVTYPRLHQVWQQAPGGAPQPIGGTAGRAGLADGTGSDALFDAPLGLALDAAGQLYVADTANARIRRRGTDGRWTTLSWQGGLRQPMFVALHAPTNEVYVSTRGGGGIVRLRPDGAELGVVTLSGLPGYGNLLASDGERYLYGVGSSEFMSSRIWRIDLTRLPEAGPVSLDTAVAGVFQYVVDGDDLQMAVVLGLTFDRQGHLHVTTTSHQVLRFRAPLVPGALPDFVAIKTFAPDGSDLRNLGALAVGAGGDLFIGAQSSDAGMLRLAAPPP